MELPRACVDRFNRILSLLQAKYGQSASAPVKSPIDGREIKYTVLFHFDRDVGIDAEVTLADPKSSAVITGSRTAGSHSGRRRPVLDSPALPAAWLGRESLG